MADPRRPFLVDTDGGIDDITALWWLPERDDVDIVDITIVDGNVTPIVAAANVGRGPRYATRRFHPRHRRPR
jgi:inosine-uridine nucleoside N-ribohydrolase